MYNGMQCSGMGHEPRDYEYASIRSFSYLHGEICASLMYELAVAADVASSRYTCMKLCTPRPCHVATGGAALGPYANSTVARQPSSGA